MPFTNSSSVLNSNGPCCLNLQGPNTVSSYLIWSSLKQHSGNRWCSTRISSGQGFSRQYSLPGCRVNFFSVLPYAVAHEPIPPAYTKYPRAPIPPASPEVRMHRQVLSSQHPARLIGNPRRLCNAETTLHTCPQSLPLQRSLPADHGASFSTNRSSRYEDFAGSAYPSATPWQLRWRLLISHSLRRDRARTT